MSLKNNTTSSSKPTGDFTNLIKRWKAQQVEQHLGQNLQQARRSADTSQPVDLTLFSLWCNKVDNFSELSRPHKQHPCNILSHTEISKATAKPSPSPDSDKFDNRGTPPPSLSPTAGPGE